MLFTRKGKNHAFKLRVVSLALEVFCQYSLNFMFIYVCCMHVHMYVGIHINVCVWRSTSHFYLAQWLCTFYFGTGFLNEPGTH